VNPLLQYPEMVIHPPMLYLVMWASRFLCLCAGRGDGCVTLARNGFKITRAWTMVTWLF